MRKYQRICLNLGSVGEIRAQALRAALLMIAIILLLVGCYVQGTDCPDNVSTTCNVEIGTTVAGYINTSDDRDQFRVSLIGGTEYRIQLNGGGDRGYDVQVFAHGSTSGRTEDEAGDKDFTFQPRSSGIYYILVYSPENTTGNYTLSITTDDDDCLNTTSTTCNVRLDSSRTGFIENTGDADWFRVSLTGSMNYRIQLEGPDSSNFNVEVFSADGSTTGTSGTVAGDEDLIYQPSTSDSYYIQVSGISGTGSYTLQISVLPDDCLESTSTTCTLTVGSSVTGFIESTGDADWFRVSLTGGTNYRIQLDGPDGSNFNVEVFSADGSTTGTSGTDAGDEDFTYMPSTSASYYIQVSGISGTGVYTLSSIVGGDCLNTISTTCSIEIGSSVTGSIETAADSDWFRVPLTGGTNYRIQLDGPDGNDFDVSVRRADGSSTGVSGTRSGDDDFTYRPNTSASYYIRVYSYRGTGNYTLRVTAQ